MAAVLYLWKSPVWSSYFHITSCLPKTNVYILEPRLDCFTAIGTREARAKRKSNAIYWLALGLASDELPTCKCHAIFMPTLPSEKNKDSSELVCRIWCIVYEITKHRPEFSVNALAQKIILHGISQRPCQVATPYCETKWKMKGFGHLF